MTTEDSNTIEAQSNFTIIPNGVLNADISDRAFRVYTMLRSYLRPGCETFPKIATVAERFGKDARYLERGISELTEAGLLVVRKKSFNNSTKRINSYYFPNVADNHSPTNATAPGPTDSTAPRPTDSTGSDPTNSTAPIEEEKLEEEKLKKDTAAPAAEAATLFTPAISEPIKVQAEVGANGYRLDASGILAEWIDHCDPKPPSRVSGQMAREIKNLLTEGFEYDAVRDGLIQLYQKGYGPSTLPSFVHNVQQRGTLAMQPSGKHNGGQGMATGTQRAMQAVAIGQQLQAQQNQQNALGGTARGFTADQHALGAGSLDRQPEGGRGDDSGVVGNPRPFRFQ